MLMTCLNERIVGAMFLMLSGNAFAGGSTVAMPEEMTVANIAPLPLEVVTSVPEPQTWLHRYEMQFQSNQGKPYYAQVEGFYSAPVTQTFHFGAERAAPTPDPLPQGATSFLQGDLSAVSQLALRQVPDSTLAIGAQPQRRLSLTVDDWDFSATARVAILHSHSTGAVLSVQHGF
jgi:hypothetical protein